MTREAVHYLNSFVGLRYHPGFTMTVTVPGDEAF